MKTGRGSVGELFKTGRGTVERAIELKSLKGILRLPELKRGNTLNADVISRIINFYSDHHSGNL